jgi:hypothetical protein
VQHIVNCDDLWLPRQTPKNVDRPAWNVASAQLQLRLPDRFGIPVEPKEWFVVPLAVINDVMERIQDESITDFVYDSAAGTLRRVDKTH